MAKQNGTLPKIDEDFMRELISQGVPTKQDKQPEGIPNPATKRASPKRDNKRKRYGWRNRHPAGARVVRAITGKPTSRKWN